jgi:tRNA (cytidine/uridine-2'-O-)-methyltransferase
MDPHASNADGVAIALIEPDRPHNMGAALRLGACLGVPLHIIEPAGFPLDDRRIRQASLDYAPLADWRRHASFAAFRAHAERRGARLVLLTTRGDRRYDEVPYAARDILVCGSESRGAPEELHGIAALRVRVPMRQGARSLNVVIAAAIVLGEALRQTGGFDKRVGAR